MDETVINDWLEHATASGVNLTRRSTERRRRRGRKQHVSYTRDPEMDPIEYEQVLKSKDHTPLPVYWKHLARWVQPPDKTRVFSSSYLRSPYYVYLNEAIERSLYSLYVARDIRVYSECLEHMRVVLAAWDAYMIANRAKLPTMGLEGRNEVTNPWMCRIRLYLLVNFALIIEDPMSADHIACLKDMEKTFVSKGPILATRGTPVMKYTLDYTMQSLYELRACWREIPYSPGLLRYFHLLRARYAAFTSEMHDDEKIMNRVQNVSRVTLEDGRTKMHINREFFEFGEEVMHGMDEELELLDRICAAATRIYCCEARERGYFVWTRFPERYEDNGCYREFDQREAALVCPALPFASIVHFFNWIFQYTDTARGPYIMGFFRSKLVLKELIRPGERWSFEISNQAADANDINVINRMRPQDMDRYQNMLLKTTTEEVMRCIKLYLVRHYQLDSWPDHSFDEERQRREEIRLERMAKANGDSGEQRMNENNANLICEEEEVEDFQRESDNLEKLTQPFFGTDSGSESDSDQGWTPERLPRTEAPPKMEFIGDPLFRNDEGVFQVDSCASDDEELPGGSDFGQAISNAKLKSQISSLAFSAGGPLKLLEEESDRAPAGFLDYSSMGSSKKEAEEAASEKRKPADFWIKKRRQGFHEEEGGHDNEEEFFPEEYPGLHNVWNELCHANFKYLCREMLDNAVDWDRTCLLRSAMFANRALVDGLNAAGHVDPVIFQTTSGYAVWSSRRKYVWIEFTFIEAAWRWLTELVHEEYRRTNSVLIDLGGAEEPDDIVRDNRRVMMNGACEMLQAAFGDAGNAQLAAYEREYDTTGRGRNYEKMQLEKRLDGLDDGEKERRRIQHRYQTSGQVSSGALNASKIPQVFLG